MILAPILLIIAASAYVVLKPAKAKPEPVKSSVLSTATPEVEVVGGSPESMGVAPVNIEDLRAEFFLLAGKVEREKVVPSSSDPSKMVGTKCLTKVHSVRDPKVEYRKVVDTPTATVYFSVEATCQEGERTTERVSKHYIWKKVPGSPAGWVRDDSQVETMRLIWKEEDLAEEREKKEKEDIAKRKDDAIKAQEQKKRLEKELLNFRQ